MIDGKLNYIMRYIRLIHRGEFSMPLALEVERVHLIYLLHSNNCFGGFISNLLNLFL
jgi:uncharacterized protein (DUF1919 family)